MDSFSFPILRKGDTGINIINFQAPPINACNNNSSQQLYSGFFPLMVYSAYSFLRTVLEIFQPECILCVENHENLEYVPY